MKKVYFPILLIFCIFPLIGCNNQKEAFTKTDFCFDTAISITVYESVSKSVQTEALLDETMALCRTYDKMFSPTIVESDIYRINHAKGQWTKVSDETVQLIQSALEYCKMTGGQIDITIAPVKNLWDFSGTENVKMPKLETIAETLPLVDYTRIEIDGTKVRLTNPNAAIDLGFIAKGYIADHVRAFLMEKGVKSALINLGGNIAVIGEKPDGTPFQIGIQEPFKTAGSYCSIVSSSQTDTGTSSVVTSGTYERSFEYNGKLYHHIIDCKTGMPAETDLSGVTIITDSALHADALSTTCILLGLDEGVSYIKSLDNVEAIFITTDGKIVDTRE